MREDNLIERFIASFNKLDEMADFPEINPLVRQFALGEPDTYGRLLWKPLKVPPIRLSSNLCSPSFPLDSLPYSKTSFSLTGGLKSI